MIFGKRLTEYLAFEKSVLALIAVVGIVKLALSLAGVADSATKYVSITVVGIAAVVYLGVVTYTKGFGSYRQLLPLMVLQGLVSNAIIITGIFISGVTGKANIFTANEYGGTTSAPLHIAAHLVGGMIVGPLMGWAVSSLVMFVTKKVTPARPAVLTA
jgi:hypothetical protein